MWKEMYYTCQKVCLTLNTYNLLILNVKIQISINQKIYEKFMKYNFPSIVKCSSKQCKQILEVGSEQKGCKMPMKCLG